MISDAYNRILQQETTPEALEATVCYLVDQLRPFLKTPEPVLVCFPDEGPASLGGIYKEALRRCGVETLFWGPDYRWKSLLKLAFDSKANTIVAHPLVVLGLMKISRATQTPLYIYDVILGGYPYARWMIDGLKQGMDCRIWGFYAIRSGPVFVGFTCPQEAGFHIRQEIFKPVVLDDENRELVGIGRGRLYFVYTKDHLVYDPQETAIVHHQPCSCGCSFPRVVETNYVGEDNANRAKMEEQFLRWYSVLDYRTEQTESGTAMELVVFPGESLPKLPSFAKLTIRTWDPERDIPFCMERYCAKIPEKDR